MHMSASKPNVVVLSDGEAIAEGAAKQLVARLAQAGDRPAVCITGGEGPQRLFQLLAREPYRSRIAWSRTHWFLTDDRFVPTDSPLSNVGMARRLFLDQVGAPVKNIHAIASTAANVEEAAQLYESELKQFYASDRFDRARPLFALVLMGLGPDGHTASLFPNAPALRERERWVAGVEKAGCAPFVPRVTLTFPALASTREMLFLVSGNEKRDILARVLSGSDLPASQPWSEGELVWLVDRAAAGKDHGGT
jgi:6-phosphogluconolactonase